MRRREFIAPLAGAAPFGAKSAYQAEKESPGSPISPKIGMSGASGERVSLAPA